MANSTQNPKAPRRAISTWELDDFFRGIRRQIVANEEAFERGQLAAALPETSAWPESHPSISAAYRRLQRAACLEPAEYRSRAVHALLATTRTELFELPRRFEARPVDFRGHASATPPADPRGELELGASALQRCLPGLAVRSHRGEVYLRLDQVLAVRRWGIGFLIEDAAVSDALTSAVAHHAADQLAYALCGVEKVQVRLEARGLGAGIELVPPREGRGFEQLLCDILNEHYPCARQAPLYEDFFEKTDLRLHVRGLSRRRGARAQVTRTTEPAAHAQKLAQIHNLEEFVILSPLTLARAFCREQAELGLGDAEVRQFWHCLPDLPSTEEDLAFLLRAMLLRALDQPFSGPRGPLAAVPEPVRLLLQSYAAVSSRRTTEQLRARLRAQQAETA